MPSIRVGQSQAESGEPTGVTVVAPPELPAPAATAVVNGMGELTGRIEIDERNGPAPIVALAYHTVPSRHADALPLELLANILGGGESSRLYRRLVTSDRRAMMAENGGEIFLNGEEWELYPNNGVAIAGNSSSDRLLFLKEEGECWAEVYYWSHETGEYALIAEDFGDLIQGSGLRDLAV